ncbi:MAG: DNA/RNA nuclease SfsA [Bacillota bacterium]
MKYNNIYEGKFLNRENRFIANIKINDKVHKVHVKNTGRCNELLVKNSKVYVQFVDKKSRKTKYSLISVYKNNRLFNIDSQVPNKVILKALNNNKISSLTNLDYLKPEKKVGNSRLDFYYEKNDKKGYIEVKGVTLEKNNIGIFPDAPTKRGTKHINELITLGKEGYENYIIFLLQFKGAKKFKPNWITDKIFSETLKKAYDNGVNILAYDSLVNKNKIILNNKIDINLNK